jgi:glutamate N-acetyltransferase/amino-acid acetyltransferase
MDDLDIPETFLWSGTASGIKKSGNPDLALAYSSFPAITAGVFTTNSFPAAPVRDARRRLDERSRFRGLVVNSGVANAATGEEGMRRNREMIGSSAGLLGLEDDEVLASSTGVIGDQLPLETIEEGLPDAVDDLAEHPASFADAIMTTDDQRKISSVSLDGLDANLLGVAKGSGMIRPDMATMLGFLFLDHPVEPDFWQSTLERACDVSFNRITVDGDMSTNDTVLGWASDLPNREPIGSDDDEAEALAEAVESVCRDLAEQIVLDGEGASRLIHVTVEGALDRAVARDVADSIAGSSLVKTAVHGGDPNWGRVFSAAGATGHDLDAEAVRIKLNDVTVYDGEPVEHDAETLRASMSDSRQRIHLELGSGEQRAEALGCDLSAEYVRINAEYHT